MERKTKMRLPSQNLCSAHTSIPGVTAIVGVVTLFWCVPDFFLQDGLHGTIGYAVGE
jgi:predicted acetyltransferase